MVKQMMGVIGASIPKGTGDPKNAVADFVNTEFSKSFGGNEEIELIRILLIGICNDRPDDVMASLVMIHNDIGAFVQELNNGD